MAVLDLSPERDKGMEMGGGGAELCREGRRGDGRRGDQVGGGSGVKVVGVVWCGQILR